MTKPNHQNKPLSYTYSKQHIEGLSNDKQFQNKEYTWYRLLSEGVCYARG